MTNNLPSGYHRDYQLLKEVIIPAIQELKACLDMALYTLKDIRVNDNITDAKMYDYLFSVDTLNELVNNGMPFRDAYKKMGMEIQNGTFTPLRNIKHTHEGSIGNLCLEEIKKKMEAV